MGSTTMMTEINKTGLSNMAPTKTTNQGNRFRDSDVMCEFYTEQTLKLTESWEGKGNIM